MQYNLGRFILKPRGTYSSNTTYDKLDIVLYLGSSYVCKSNGVTNKIPTNTTYWQLIAQAGEATMTEQQKQEIIASLIAQGVVIDSNYNTFTTAEKQKLQTLTAPNDGLFTINYDGRRIGTFSADQSGSTTVNIPAAGNGVIKLVREDNDAAIGDFSVNQKEDQVIKIPVGSGGGGTANDGTLTLQQGGTTVGTFTANQSTNTTINILNQSLTIQKNGTTVTTYNPRSAQTCNITVPTAVTDLSDGANYPTYRGYSSDANNTTEDALDGDCAIAKLKANHVYYCTNAVALKVAAYEYDTTDEVTAMQMPKTYIYVEAADDFDINLASLDPIKLTNGSSTRMNTDKTYLISVCGHVWRIESLEDL